MQLPRKVTQEVSITDFFSKEKPFVFVGKLLNTLMNKSNIFIEIEDLWPLNSTG